MSINSISDSVNFYENYKKVRNNEIESFKFAGHMVELDIPKTTGLKKLISKAFSNYKKTAKINRRE